jgi:hypothetical protein
MLIDFYLDGSRRGERRWRVSLVGQRSQAEIVLPRPD